ncbi:hypothetical protein MRB53_041942 [Persea americana]|nr:hypothetical protein MRB53_041942 [Persea americana]
MRRRNACAKQLKNLSESARKRGSSGRWRRRWQGPQRNLKGAGAAVGNDVECRSGDCSALCEGQCHLWSATPMIASPPNLWSPTFYRYDMRFGNSR